MPRPRSGLGDSFSLRDLVLLARSRDDRADAIKQIYEWRRDVYVILATALLTFLLAQAGLLIENTFFPEAPQSPVEGTAAATDEPPPLVPRTFLGLQTSSLLAISITLVVLIEIYLFSLIRRIPGEYQGAITLYSLIRR